MLRRRELYIDQSKHGVFQYSFFEDHTDILKVAGNTLG